MIWLVSTALLVLAAPFVVWPLLTHWTPGPGRPEVERGSANRSEEARRQELRELEERELDR